MLVLLCIIIVSLCTLATLGVAIRNGNSNYDASPWLIITGIGMVLLTITIITICTTNWNWK